MSTKTSAPAIVKQEEKPVSNEQIPDKNYFQDYGDQASQRPIVGELLKFNKGDWLVGQDNTEIPVGTRFVAIMDQLAIGWVKWVDQMPEKQIMGLVVEGHQSCRRKDLGDIEESEWEVDDKGNPRDPWQFSNNLILRKPGLKAPVEDDDMFTFVTSSRGGINALGEVCKVYGSQMRLRPDEYPVIEIGVDAYTHKQYGRTKVPTLTIVGWEPKEPPAPAPRLVSTKTPAKSKK